MVKTLGSTTIVFLVKEHKRLKQHAYGLETKVMGKISPDDEKLGNRPTKAFRHQAYLVRRL